MLCVLFGMTSTYFARVKASRCVCCLCKMLLRISTSKSMARCRHPLPQRPSRRYEHAYRAATRATTDRVADPESPPLAPRETQLQHFWPMHACMPCKTNGHKPNALRSSEAGDSTRKTFATLPANEHEKLGRGRTCRAILWRAGHPKMWRRLPPSTLPQPKAQGLGSVAGSPAWPAGSIDVAPDRSKSA